MSATKTKAGLDPEALQNLLRAAGYQPIDARSPDGGKVPGILHQGREFYTLTASDLKVRAGSDYRVPIDPLLTTMILGHPTLPWDWVYKRFPRVAPMGQGGADVVPGTTFQYAVMNDDHWKEPPDTRLPEASPVEFVKTKPAFVTDSFEAHGLGTWLTAEERAKAGQLGAPYLAQVLALPEAMMRNAFIYEARTLLEDTTVGATHDYVDTLAAGSEWDHANNAAGGAAFTDMEALVKTVALNAGVTKAAVSLGITELALEVAFRDLDIQRRAGMGVFVVAPGASSARAEALKSMLGVKEVIVFDGYGYRSGSRAEFWSDQVYAWVNQITDGGADRFGGAQAGVTWAYNDGGAAPGYTERRIRTDVYEFLWDRSLRNIQSSASGAITNVSTG